MLFTLVTTAPNTGKTNIVVLKRVYGFIWGVCFVSLVSGVWNVSSVFFWLFVPDQTWLSVHRLLGRRLK